MKLLQKQERVRAKSINYYESNFVNYGGHRYSAGVTYCSLISILKTSQFKCNVSQVLANKGLVSYLWYFCWQRKVILSFYLKVIEKKKSGNSMLGKVRRVTEEHMESFLIKAAHSTSRDRKYF